MNNALRLTVITLLLAVSNFPAATLYVGPGSFSTIQQAVDAAAAGDEIVVTNGTYATGTALGGGYTLPNRVAVTKPVTVRSVNGPKVTVIHGYQDPYPSQYDMVRCVYLTNGARLSGFTLTGGGTFTRVGALPSGAKDGGGVWCASSSATLSNCVLTGNLAFYAGGACGGTLNNCTLANNSAYSAGGARGSALNNCRLTANIGGGASDSTLNNCLLTGNSGSDDGAGAVLCTLINCTVTGNSTSGSGGGVAACTLFNCIIYFNTAARGEPNYHLNSPSDSLNSCCTTPLPAGDGNITNAPVFVDYASGNLRLQSNSQGINAGNNAYVTTTTDLDGRPRIVGDRVDMGAYEFRPGLSGAFIGWLQQYGLPTDGSADAADTDADGMNNWQEWVCGTDPTNPLSALRQLSAAPSGTNVAVSWQSVAGVNYSLARSAIPASPFTVVATNIIGQAGATTYTDTNATGACPFFYRVGVSNP